jgi:hypothetical protein
MPSAAILQQDGVTVQFFRDKIGNISVWAAESSRVMGLKVVVGISAVLLDQERFVRHPSCPAD